MPTQPQQTKKRHRATPSQLAVLESHFRFDPSPTPETREDMSRRIQMNEKSIHIWFQNRRAKEKFLSRQRQSSATGSKESAPVAPATITPPAPSGGSPDSYSSASPPTTSSITSPDGAFAPLTSSFSRVTLTASTLDIGTWHRILTPAKDSCVANLLDKSIEYIIMEGTAKFKLGFPISNIAAMVLDTTGGGPNPHPSSYCAVLAFTLLKPPTCYMEIPTSTAGHAIWSATNDFTEGRQSSTVLVHTLTGPLPQLVNDTRLLLDMEPSLADRFMERSGAVQPTLSTTLSSLPAPPALSSVHSSAGYVTASASPAGSPLSLFSSTPTTNMTLPPQYLHYYTSSPTMNPAVTLSDGQMYIPPPRAYGSSDNAAYIRPSMMYSPAGAVAFPTTSLYPVADNVLSPPMVQDFRSEFNQGMLPAISTSALPFMIPAFAPPMSFEKSNISPTPADILLNGTMPEEPSSTFEHSRSSTGTYIHASPFQCSHP